MASKIAELIDAVHSAVVSGAAKSAAGLRHAVAQRAAAPPGEGPDVPTALRSYVDKVAHSPYKVVDEDFEALRNEGISDDIIFELTVTAALAAGLERYRRGMAALKEETS